MEHQDGTFESNLQEVKGVNQPSSINIHAAKHFRNRRKGLQPADFYVKGILDGNRVVLSQAITLVESARADHQEIAQKIIEQCLPHAGDSIRVGITGVPGVGKSTFIESFGKILTNQGKKLAVLAIDPSSERTKGSILGDKTRMEELSIDPNAFIRPSPSAGSLGGVARKTRESLILCEAAGFNVIFIETVGVGQSETAVHSMVDYFLLLMLAGAGDELQGIKRGIMEMADGIAITKADGSNEMNAKSARVQYETALHLFPASESKWMPKVNTCSSVTKQGLTSVWTNAQEYVALTKSNGFFSKKRNEQAKYWMYESINERLKESFYSDPVIKQKIGDIEKNVLDGRMSSFIGAGELLKMYFETGNA